MASGTALGALGLEQQAHIFAAIFLQNPCLGQRRCSLQLMTRPHDAKLHTLKGLTAGLFLLRHLLEKASWAPVVNKLNPWLTRYASVHMPSRCCDMSCGRAFHGTPLPPPSFCLLLQDSGYFCILCACLLLLAFFWRASACLGKPLHASAGFCSTKITKDL